MTQTFLPDAEDIYGVYIYTCTLEAGKCGLMYSFVCTYYVVCHGRWHIYTPMQYAGLLIIIINAGY